MNPAQEQHRQVKSRSSEVQRHFASGGSIGAPSQIAANSESESTPICRSGIIGVESIKSPLASCIFLQRKTRGLTSVISSFAPGQGELISTDKFTKSGRNCQFHVLADCSNYSNQSQSDFRSCSGILGQLRVTCDSSRTLRALPTF